MSEHRVLATFILGIHFVGPLLTRAADNPQTTDSSRVVISVYSYGAAAGQRIIPEQEFGRRRRRAALTDVVVTPPLATSLPAQPPAPKSASAPLPTPAPSSTPAPPPTINDPATFPNSGSVTSVPSPRVVTVQWDASSDPAVVGYKLYIGSASHQYLTRLPLGNHPSAEISIGRSVTYVAVTAYTAAGLESPVSEELVITLDPNDAVNWSVTTSPNPGG